MRAHRPSHRPRLAAVLVTAVLTLPVSVGAQERGPGTGVRDAVASLGDSSVVRVIAPGVYVDPGYFLGVLGDSIRLGDADVELLVAFDEVEELAVRKNRWLTLGIAVGGIAAVFGAAAGFFIGTTDCGLERKCGGDQVRGAARWGGALGGLGFGVGAIVGARMYSWRVVFP